MCGIIGGTQSEWNYTAALNSLEHRGPDSHKIVSHPELTLAFARLAILDLTEKATQPMSNIEQTVWIVFNGEIYGFIDLRNQLEAFGHKFLTTSDTEVVLHAYLHWGDSFTDHIDGMFAIGIHDIRTKELKLYRDRVGIKPLYYFYDGKHLAFASELKTLKILCYNIGFEEDYTAYYDFLTYKYIPAPKTMYKKVYKLPPAHSLTFDLTTNTIKHFRPFWKLNTETTRKTLSLPETCQKLRELIRESIRNQMIADVPVGFFLSGGLDSSTVVCESRKLNALSRTFTIGFDDPKHTEVHYAELVARKYQTDHHQKILSSSQTEDLFTRMKNWFDEPFADSSAYPTFQVAQFAKEYVTVVLTGDGGDEVFGGYRWYWLMPVLHKIPFLKNMSLVRAFSNMKSCFSKKSFFYKLSNQLELFASDDLPCYIKLIGGMTSDEKVSYAQRWDIPKNYDSYWYLRSFYRPELPLRTRLQYMDFHTFLPDDILTKVDRTSMSVSLEARVPLLSKNILEFCFSIPEDVRYFNNDRKGLLKETYRDVLPAGILQRGKQGFSIPKSYFTWNNEYFQETILKKLFI